MVTFWKFLKVASSSDWNMQKRTSSEYPEDKPILPYFTGWLGYQIREIFVRYLAAAPRLERRWPGLFVWLGKGRYEHAQRRQQAKAKQNAIQLVEYNEGT
jgi:hypothetical protein